MLFTWTNCGQINPLRVGMSYTVADTPNSGLRAISIFALINRTKTTVVIHPGSYLNHECLVGIIKGKVPESLRYLLCVLIQKLEVFHFRLRSSDHNIIATAYVANKMALHHQCYKVGYCTHSPCSFC